MKKNIASADGEGFAQKRAIPLPKLHLFFPLVRAGFKLPLGLQFQRLKQANKKIS